MGSTDWDDARHVCGARDAGVRPTCPSGMTLAGSPPQQRCVCSSGMRWEPSARVCVQDTCGGGTHWDARTLTCVCPTDASWSARSRRCIPSACPAGMVFRAASDMCGCGAASPLWNASRRECEACPGGQRWNGAECTCVGGQILESGRCTCPSNQHWANNRCEVCNVGLVWNGAQCECPRGQHWANNECQVCNGGSTWNGNQCVCTVGTSWNGSQCASLQRIAAPAARGGCHDMTFCVGSERNAYNPTEGITLINRCSIQVYCRVWPVQPSGDEPAYSFIDPGHRAASSYFVNRPPSSLPYRCVAATDDQSCAGSHP